MFLNLLLSFKEISYMFTDSYKNLNKIITSQFHTTTVVLIYA
jgi:hypothetical protein